MLSSAVAFNPPLVSISNQLGINRRPPLPLPPSSFFTFTLKLKTESTKIVVNRRTIMASGSLGDERILNNNNNQVVEAFEQEALIDIEIENENELDGGRLHAMVNLMSKWIVAVSFGGFLFVRRDALALWAAMGSVINMILSVTLKQILKQERPVSRVSSGHGMPSSHAQAIFYTIVCIILSLVEFHGFSGVSAISSICVVAIGSYFSWLRVTQRYHTAIQVIVGAIVGSVFAVVWFWAWEALVYKAYESNLVVQVLVTVGAAGFTLGFISHVIRHWLKVKIDGVLHFIGRFK
ncbi:lipid phosphate phosphatase epsilon 1, chloroplastic-like [Bidens hawaiensis]|uniref:lipid phosphate phosphatase epsilon 1, chloroplastic-like n=1 Tax=Bidens hawaiensis TaxID=980011 RepID=UPI00404AB625